MMQISGNVKAGISALGLNSWLPASLQHQLTAAMQPLQLLNRLNDPNHIYVYCENCPL